MNSTILYTIALVFLFLSFVKDRQKTKMALLKAWKSFTKLLPEVLAIMIFVGISLAVLSPDTISKLIGSESGLLGIIIALIGGSFTLIPSFVAFPLAVSLLNGGAGYAQIAALVSTLMSVGIVTLPTEIKYFNKSTAILRNFMSFVVAIIFTLVIGEVMK
ncbi:MAG: permease [Thermoanaerobacteraceae bacterium]|nr:permease [Thermoanaerobacteraceae bacterium]